MTEPLYLLIYFFVDPADENYFWDSIFRKLFYPAHSWNIVKLAHWCGAVLCLCKLFFRYISFFRLWFLWYTIILMPMHRISKTFNVFQITHSSFSTYNSQLKNVLAYCLLFKLKSYDQYFLFFAPMISFGHYSPTSFSNVMKYFD